MVANHGPPMLGRKSACTPFAMRCPRRILTIHLNGQRDQQRGTRKIWCIHVLHLTKKTTLSIVTENGGPLFTGLVLGLKRITHAHTRKTSELCNELDKPNLNKL